MVTIRNLVDDVAVLKELALAPMAYLGSARFSSTSTRETLHETNVKVCSASGPTLGHGMGRSIFEVIACCS